MTDYKCGDNPIGSPSLNLALYAFKFANRIFSGARQHSINQFRWSKQMSYGCRYWIKSIAPFLILIYSSFFFLTAYPGFPSGQVSVPGPSVVEAVYLLARVMETINTLTTELQMKGIIMGWKTLLLQDIYLQGYIHTLLIFRFRTFLLL